MTWVLAIVLCSGWSPGAVAVAQDAKAYQLATDLRQRGVPVDDVVRELVAAFRLNAPAVARVLRAERIDAAAAATSISGVMRVPAGTAVGALLEASYDAPSAAKAAVRLSLDAGATASVFRARSVDAEVAARVLAAEYPRAHHALAADLHRAAYTAVDVARGVRGLTRTGGEAFEAVRAADFALADLRLAGRFLFLRTPAEYVAAMKAAGESAHDVALVLKNGYGLDALAGASLLCVSRPAGVWHPYPAVYMAAALREVWQIDAVAAYRVLKDHPYPFILPWEILEGGGYELVRPTIDGYRIGDYRPGHAGYLESVGVINPGRIVGTPDSWDGEVEIRVRYRELDGLTAINTGGGVETPGDILGREPVDYMVDGVLTPGEWLRVKFYDIRTGSIGLLRTGRYSGAPVLALAHAGIDAAVVEGPLSSLQVALGVPAGSGSAVVPAGTHGGVTIQGSTTVFDVPAYTSAGTSASVIDMTSSSVSVTTTYAGAGMLNLDIEVLFEENGAEVSGTFLEYVPCWRCASFEVPQSQCAAANINCILGVIGGTLASLGTCLDPANWVEGQMAAGPAVPFEADLTAPKLTLMTKVAAQNDAFHVHPMVAQFHAGIALRSGPSGVPLGPILQNYILGQINGGLAQAIEDVDLAGTLQGSLEFLRGTLLGGGRLRGVYLMVDGRWFTDLSY